MTDPLKTATIGKVIRRVNQQLEQFLGSLHVLGGQPGDRELRRETEALYRDIHETCLRYGIEDASLNIEGFDERQQATIRKILWLGRNNFNVFSEEATSHLQRSQKKRDPQAVAVAFAEFIKSTAAHDLVHGGDAHTQELDEAIIGLFNGMFGIQITQGLAKSIRVEHLGRILAYAMSSQCDTDLEALEKDPANLDPDTRNAWLMQRIMAANRTFHYRVETTENGKQNVAAAVSDLPFEFGSTRGGWVADACVVDTERKTLIIGGATSRLTVDNEQTGQAVDKRLAAELLVQQPFVGDPGKPNAFYGWSIESFQINLGIVAADRLADTGRGRGQQMMARLFPKRQADRQDILALSQLGHLSMFAEKDAAYGEAGRVLGLTNIHLIGCDTLPYYHKRQEAVAQGGRAMATLVLETLNEAAQVLARPDTALPLGQHGTGSVKPMLETLIGVVRNHFSNFPAINIDNVSERELDLLGELKSCFHSIGRKINDDNPDNNAYRRSLREIRFLLDDRDAMAESIREDAKMPDKHMHWSNTIWQRLDDKDRLTNTVHDERKPVRCSVN